MSHARVKAAAREVYWGLASAWKMYENEGKLHIRRLEPAIHKFIKVAIPTDLERLRKHQINIEKYQRCQLWDKLHKEHVNAGRTVQQLRANVQEMEKVCARVRTEDADALERLVRPIKNDAASATAQFLQLHSQSAEALSRQLGAQHSSFQAPLPRSSTTGPLCETEAESMSQSQTQVQMFAPLPEIPQDQNAAESWEVLEGDLLELSNLVTEFSQLVHSQQEKIDSIEENVTTAVANVEEGTKSLGKAAKLKIAALPIAGALLGGVIGGPLGLLAGLKVGGIAAALGGGVLGFTGGKLIQKTKQKRIEKELSASCPALSNKVEEPTSEN